MSTHDNTCPPVLIPRLLDSEGKTKWLVTTRVAVMGMPSTLPGNAASPQMLRAVYEGKRRTAMWRRSRAGALMRRPLSSSFCS